MSGHGIDATSAIGQAIRVHTTGVLRARLAYRLQPTAVGDLGCLTCNEPTGTGLRCKTCRKTAQKRKRRQREQKK